jgi:hypothetical protein
MVNQVLRSGDSFVRNSAHTCFSRRGCYVVAVRMVFGVTNGALVLYETEEICTIGE